MNKISYIKSSDRQYNIERCLSLINSEIFKDLKNAKNVVIKPCAPVLDNQLASTHIETLFSVIDFISPHVKGQITLAEGAIGVDTFSVFENYGYHKLRDYFDLAFIDLNFDEYEILELENEEEKPLQAHISKTLLESDYIISVCPPKTDSELLFSGATNNIVKSSFVKDIPKGMFWLRKQDIRSRALSNFNIAQRNIQKLRDKFRIGLSVIDGFTIMTGEGPIDGQLAMGHYAIASNNSILADILACKCMGLDFSLLKSLGSSDDWSDYFVTGDSWQSNVLEIAVPEKFST